MDGSSFSICAECGQNPSRRGRIFCRVCIRRKCFACGIVFSNHNQCRCGQFHGRTRDGVYCIDCHSIEAKTFRPPERRLCHA